MTAHDNYLLRGADGPAPLDEGALQDAISDVSSRVSRELRVDEIIQAIYNAGPAINHALREIEFPAHLREGIVALAKLSADIRAEVDNDYIARTSTFDDARN